MSNLIFETVGLNVTAYCGPGGEQRIGICVGNQVTDLSVDEASELMAELAMWRVRILRRELERAGIVDPFGPLSGLEPF